jgi:carbamoyltransferase
MANVLGVNAVVTAPAAALVVDGEVVAATEEERFTRAPVIPGETGATSWRLPVAAMRWCLLEAGLDAVELDAVAYPYDPARVPSAATHADRGDHGDQVLTADRSEFADLADLADLGHLLDHEWCRLRTLYARRAPSLIWSALPGLDPTRIVHVGHDRAQAASAWGPSGFESCAVMVIDGRGEATSFLAGRSTRSGLEVMATQPLPHSLGLLYENLAAHLHVRRTCEEHEMSAIAANGRTTHLERLRKLVRIRQEGGFTAESIDWNQFTPPGRGDPGDPHDQALLHESVDRRAADLARSVQERLEEIVLELAVWTHERTGEERLVVAGDVALNRLVMTRLQEEGPFGTLWAPPVTGDAGTALGAAVAAAASLGDDITPMTSAALGPTWNDDEIEPALRKAGVRSRRVDDIAEEVAAVLASDRVVAWVQGRADVGHRPLGHRSVFMHPGGRPGALGEACGRVPVIATTTEDAAPQLFHTGPLPSPLAMFVHHVTPLWAERVPRVIHADGLARAHTLSAGADALTHRMVRAFERRTGLPVIGNVPISSISHSLTDDPAVVLDACRRGVIDVVAIGSLLIERC